MVFLMEANCFSVRYYLERFLCKIYYNITRLRINIKLKKYMLTAI